DALPISPASRRRKGRCRRRVRNPAHLVKAADECRLPSWHRRVPDPASLVLGIEIPADALVMGKRDGASSPRTCGTQAVGPELATDAARTAGGHGERQLGHTELTDTVPFGRFGRSRRVQWASSRTSGRSIPPGASPRPPPEGPRWLSTTRIS